MEEHGKLLASLATALVDHPRASLQELAKAAGTSKTTLYRLCRTREQLINTLVQHSDEVFSEVIKNAELQTTPPLDALKKLILLNLEQRELLVFMIHHLRYFSDESNCSWEISMDAFFFKGQQQGIFRIDVTAATLTEICGGIVIGLIDAERRGRVARAGLPALIENAILNCVLLDKACHTVSD